MHYKQVGKVFLSKIAIFFRSIFSGIESLYNENIKRNDKPYDVLSAKSEDSSMKNK